MNINSLYFGSGDVNDIRHIYYKIINSTKSILIE